MPTDFNADVDADADDDVNADANADANADVNADVNADSDHGPGDDKGLVSSAEPDDRRKDRHKHRIKQASIFNFVYPNNIVQKYKLKEVLGQGTFGVVRLCEKLETGEKFALKTILKSRVPDVDLLKSEIEILSEVDHPHIIKLYDVFEDVVNVYLITELCTGGELYDRVVAKTHSPEGHFSEFDAARILRNVLSGIRYCHEEKHIVHRDLKPENFLLTDNTDDAQVKIIDFGLSTHTKTSESMHDQVGTIYYVAPEVLNGDYNEKVDIWSIGVTAYVMLCGYAPFNGGTEFLTYDLVKAGEIVFPSPSWDHISVGAIGFVKRLLNLDPKQRPSASEALADPWLRQEKVQPHGLAWAASFIPKFSRHASDVADHHHVKHVDEEKRSRFASFRDHVKSKKAYAHRSSTI